MMKIVIHVKGFRIGICKMRFLVIVKYDFFYIPMLRDIAGNLKAFLKISFEVEAIEIISVSEG